MLYVWPGCWLDAENYCHPELLQRSEEPTKGLATMPKVLQKAGMTRDRRVFSPLQYLLHVSHSRGQVGEYVHRGACRFVDGRMTHGL